MLKFNQTDNQAVCKSTMFNNSLRLKLSMTCEPEVVLVVAYCRLYAQADDVFRCRSRPCTCG